MVNHNGRLVSIKEPILNADNRAFKFGDGVFDTLKVLKGQIVFLEDHYFRLMASMRILRMEIPMDFSLEFFEAEILKLVKIKNLEAARVRITIYRKDGGAYHPLSNEIDFVIAASNLVIDIKETYEVELFKDFYIYSGLLSTLKTTNKILNVIASVFAKENTFDNCLLINESKQLVEAIHGNIFLVIGNKLVTPALTEGCVKGVIREKVIDIVKKSASFEIEERPISPFELKKADELFITNSIMDIQSVTKYRKKHFNVAVAAKIKGLLEALYA
jgi:branched-chain amino acid aminotransferase